jgi:hypothetical protein
MEQSNGHTLLLVSVLVAMAAHILICGHTFLPVAVSMLEAVLHPSITMCISFAYSASLSSSRETDPVSEAFGSVQNTRQSTQSRIPVI